MEERYDSARGRLSVAKAKDAYKKLWAELTHRINSLGLGEGSPERWQKNYAKKKLIRVSDILNIRGCDVIWFKPIMYYKC
ncbi:hypothetical protein NQ317_015879 [Molorchus minor]|uniref:Regulatory protein zeste n=1 Tax=Molorchus minor TaxID=1323400 RepID=A0ABQ9J1X1_9CUCU|nr:hypothetical protein NQ317_015879 [Molorchus minor]